MSKNYEILREAEKDLELFQTGPEKARAGNVANAAFNGAGRTRDEILRLIQRVFLNDIAAAPGLVVFSAVDRGNGCSWVCAHAAAALAAHVDGPVCLVDANLRSPSLHRYFGVYAGRGLPEALQESAPVHNFVREIPGKNLWLMSCGALPPDLEDLASAGKMRSRLVELCAEFKHVLVDAPPVNASADALALGKMADGLVLVVEANATRRESARKAIESMEAAQVKPLGVVLNKRTFPIPNALYNRV